MQRRIAAISNVFSVQGVFKAQATLFVVFGQLLEVAAAFFFLFLLECHGFSLSKDHTTSLLFAGQFVNKAPEGVADQTETANGNPGAPKADSRHRIPPSGLSVHRHNAQCCGCPHGGAHYEALETIPHNAS
jgi:hypothetical protein